MKTDYDDRGRIIARQDSRFSKWKFTEYDDRDNLISVTDPLRHVLTLAYDLDDRLILKTKFIYDDPTKLVPLDFTPVRQHLEQMGYHLLGDQLRHDVITIDMTKPEIAVRSTEWRYDFEQRLKLIRTPNAVAGVVPDAQIHQEHCNRGMISAVTYSYGGSNPGTVSYWYNEQSQPAATRDPRQNTRITNYDALGRVMEVIQQDTTTTHYEYDGAVISRSWVEGPVDTGPKELDGTGKVHRVLRETFFELDAANRVIVSTAKVFFPRRSPKDRRSRVLGGTDRKLVHPRRPPGKNGRSCRANYILHVQ